MSVAPEPDDHARLRGLRALLRADYTAILRQATGGRDVSFFKRLIHLCLPGMQVAILHRVAHCLYARGWRRAAAGVAELNLRVTGAVIHPGSRFGPGFFLPHPVSVVLCATAGHSFSVLPGTLVAPRDLPMASSDFPADAPQFGDGVVVGAHGAVVGDVSIGTEALVGAGVCTLRDVPADVHTILAQRQSYASRRAAARDAG